VSERQTVYWRRRQVSVPLEVVFSAGVQTVACSPDWRRHAQRHQPTEETEAPRITSQNYQNHCFSYSCLTWHYWHVGS